ncbi:MAG: hypothetical protein FWD78_12760 [Treponema sp.]|nr:hypothetical protein [Treponema sp.]
MDGSSGSSINQSQIIWKVTYTYDREGNLTGENDGVTKIVYSYITMGTTG